MSEWFDLLEIRIENLRAFRDSSLALTRSKTVLVGPNNAGKTSLLRLLDWLFNGLDLARLNAPASAEDLQFLLPARSTKNRARRITLKVQVHDGRSYNKFGCDTNGVASLRIAVRLTPKPTIFVRLGAATRGEKPESEAAGLDLLQRLRKEFDFVYVPAFRDAASTRFRDLLGGVLTDRVTEETLHSVQGGAPRSYRKIKTSLKDAEQVVEQAVRDVWGDVSQELSRTLVKGGTVLVESDVEDYVRWLASQLVLRITTGPHDSKTVLLSELGSGLQSQLYLAIKKGRSQGGGRRTVLAVEEPEAFLHPAQQRAVARKLLASSDQQVLASTHSQLIVEEATHDAIVVCRDQRFYEPDLSTERRNAISTALLRAEGAEMMFASSVLLVEGPGDQALFEQVRRRLAALDRTGRVEELSVVPVGGKERFRPWIELLRSYDKKEGGPIAWHIVADGDAATSVRSAFRDAEIPWPPAISSLGDRVTQGQAQSAAQWRAALQAFNKATAMPGRASAAKALVPVTLLDVDVESSALAQVSAATTERLSQAFGWGTQDRRRLIGWLGSKDPEATGQSKGKQAYRMGVIGAEIPLTATSATLRACVNRWLRNGGFSARAAANLISQASA